MLPLGAPVSARLRRLTHEQQPGVYGYSLCHLPAGLDPYYFEKFNPAQISKHVHSFIAAKKVLLQAVISLIGYTRSLAGSRDRG